MRSGLRGSFGAAAGAAGGTCNADLWMGVTPSDSERIDANLGAVFAGLPSSPYVTRHVSELGIVEFAEHALAPAAAHKGHASVTTSASSAPFGSKGNQGVAPKMRVATQAMASPLYMVETCVQGRASLHAVVRELQKGQMRERRRGEKERCR